MSAFELTGFYLVTIFALARQAQCQPGTRVAGARRLSCCKPQWRQLVLNPFMNNYFQDKVALVTGGAKGIGFACAVQFLKRASRVAVVSRTETEIKQAQASLGALGEVLCQVADVTDEHAMKRVVSSIRERWGRLDFLVNNAAIVDPKPLSNISTSEWDRVMETNVRGPWLCAREALSLMKSGGAIVNMGSLAGVRGTTKFPGFGAYTTSKFAVVGLTEAMAVEFAELGIRVNCVAPGAVDTELLRRVAPQLKAKAKPDDIAESVLFLCDGERSRCTTGTTLEIFTNV